MDLSRLKENLEDKGYEVKEFDTEIEAANYINESIDNEYVGIGGSETIKSLGLYDLLSTHNDVYFHEAIRDHLDVMSLRRKAAQADIYLSSVNAISMNGEIVNIDNTGNRVAALSFGPREVYLIVGTNKITDNLDSAIHRARNIAAPLNAKRLHRKTPCSIKADQCYDCKSTERICRNFSIFTNKPTGIDYHVILINQNLGY